MEAANAILLQVPTYSLATRKQVVLFQVELCPAQLLLRHHPTVIAWCFSLCEREPLGKVTFLCSRDQGGTLPSHSPQGNPWLAHVTKALQLP